jgi:alpha-L-fucosidase 2
MPLGNGKLGVNVWADSSDTVWLLLSHVDALDENTNLDKLGRVAVRATTAADDAGSLQAFRQEMHLANATVTVDLPSGVSVDVWVDATTDAVRVASSGPPHKLEATLEVWRNATKPMDWCPGPNSTSRSDVCPQGELQGCSSQHPNLTLSADVVEGKDAGILFYHRNPDTEGWAIDLKAQQMPLDLPSPMTNITFGGFLTGGAGSKMARKGMQLVSETTATTQSLSVGGTAGRFDDGVAAFEAEVTAAAAKPASRAAHEAVWSAFWGDSYITITAAASPADAAVAANADRVTLMDKVTRAASHSMSRGNISGIHSQAYGIFSAYDPPREDYRIWGPCQWFQVSTTYTRLLFSAVSLSSLTTSSLAVASLRLDWTLLHAEHAASLLSHASGWAVRGHEEPLQLLSPGARGLQSPYQSLVQHR